METVDKDCMDCLLLVFYKSGAALFLLIIYFLNS